jgi:hypothetical protein
MTEFKYQKILYLKSSQYHKLKIIGFMILLFLFSCKSTQNLLVKTEIICNDKSINKEDLEYCLRQKPNKKILWVVKLHLGIYQLVDLEKERVREVERAAKLEIINNKKRADYLEKVKKYEKKELYYKKLADSFAISNPAKSAKYKEKAKEYEALKNEGFLKKEKIFNFYQWCLEIGEAPVIYDKNLTRKSITQIKQYLRNRGYYNAKVKDSVVFKKKKVLIKEQNGIKEFDTIKHVAVYYKIYPEEPCTIDSIGFHIEDDWIKKYIIDDQKNSLLKIGLKLDADLLQSERDRISSFLRQNGYYKFSKQYVYFDVVSNSENQKVKVFIGIKKPVDETGAEIGQYHKKYRINNVYIFPDFNPKRALERQAQYYADFDTAEFVYKNDFHFNFVTKYPSYVKNGAITRQLYIYRDSLFNIVNFEDSYKHLASMKIFKLINIEMQEKDTVEVTFVDKMFKEIRTQVNNIRHVFSDSIKYGYLDCNIKLMPTTLQSATFEFEGTNTSGNIGAAGNFLYQHKNIFNGAETFDFKLKTAFEKQVNTVSGNGDNFFNSYEIGTEFHIEFPKVLLLPNFKYETFQKRYNPKTDLTIAFNYQERPDYARRIINLGFGYTWKSSEYYSHYFSPLTFNSIDLTKASDDFISYLLKYGLYNSYKDYLIASMNILLFIRIKMQNEDATSYFSV